ncbi:MAG: glycoside hydrolase family 3 C-terminal domain-containing protein [Clostridia bacterium]
MKEEDYKAILSKLTLEQKASLCSGLTFWLTKPIEEYGVPSVWVSDGPNGLRKEKVSGGTNIMQQAEPATCFPPSVTTASTWNPELVEEVGDAIAKEAKALHVCTVLGPGVNIKRSPLCGRNFEYFSEDPFLTGRMGAAWVHGVQKNNVGVSLKHFAANNQEHLRLSIDTIIDERTLREIYLSAFEYIVKTEQPSTVMCSYNRLNGKHLSDNKRLLTDILRDEWGFKGIVVSDWGAVNNRVEGVKAGMDLEMPGNNAMNDKNIVAAVKDNKLSMAELDKVVLRMLKFAFENKANEVDNFNADFDANHNICKKVASEGAVLLKNCDKSLPLKKEEKLAVIGTLAKKIRYQGAGSSHINPTKIVSFTDACDMAGQAYDYADGYTLKGDGYSGRLIKEACKVAEGKDKVVVFVGLTDEYESEGYDRKHINLPDSHNILIDELLKVNKNVIVVLSCGSPVKVSAWENNVKAILNLYLGGQAGGEAAYDLIYGKINPSGKLAETFPLRNHDNITARYFGMGPRNVQYRESIYVGYRFFDAAGRKVQYPFGYGLSYTSFEYSDIKLSANKINEGEPLTVTFKIKNTGDVAGAEIAELYVADIKSTIFRPKRELKGFKKVFLEVGEEKEISISLDSRAFSYYNVNIKDWSIESGDFDILIGASSRDIKLSATVNVVSKCKDTPIPDYRETAPYYYDIKKVDEGKKNIPYEQFHALYGADFAENLPYKIGEFDVNNCLEQVSISPWGKFLFRVISSGARLVAHGSENKGMVVESIKDLPIRSFAGFTGGIVSQKSVDGIVDMCNRKRGGLRRCIKGFMKTKEEKAELKLKNETAKAQKAANSKKHRGN